MLGFSVVFTTGTIGDALVNTYVDGERDKDNTGVCVNPAFAKETQMSLYNNNSDVLWRLLRRHSINVFVNAPTGSFNMALYVSAQVWLSLHPLNTNIFGFFTTTLLFFRFI